MSKRYAANKQTNHNKRMRCRFEGFKHHVKDKLESGQIDVEETNMAMKVELKNRVTMEAFQDELRRAVAHQVEVGR